MVRHKQVLAAAAAGVLLIALVVQAADISNAITDAESRRRAAENGLKDIKTKSPPPSERIRTAYTEAATRQNAWLDAVCLAVEQGASTAPDVAAMADSAATSLVGWVSVRNKALALPELTGPAADGVKKSVTGT
jgi:hypothetical protein